MELLFTGKEHELYLPTGRVITIRETNGDDDELLSTIKDARTGDSQYHFLANIVLKDSTIPNKKPDVKDILGWPVSDRYYTLLRQRMINQGESMEFDFICQTPECPSQKGGEKPQTLIQDLNEYDGNLSDPNYKPKLSTQVQKYPLGDKQSIEFETSSKRKVKYKILTGALEKRRLDIPVENAHKNSHLYLRELELFNEGQWLILTHFKMFPSREMSEIRRHIDDNDPLFDPMVKFNCPVCKTGYSIPLLSMPVFYWPEERI